jgi:hypothetical protein
LTTIAYHKASGQLAGDKLFNICNTPVSATKIFHDKNTGLLFAASGGVDNANLFYDWIKSGRPDDRKPVMNLDRGGFSGMIIEDGEIYRYEAGLFPQKLDVPFWAMGSGGDYAFGAMEMGADAVKAVEVATKFDINTGMGVDVLHYEAKP